MKLEDMDLTREWKPPANKVYRSLQMLRCTSPCIVASPELIALHCKVRESDGST